MYLNVPFNSPDPNFYNNLKNQLNLVSLRTNQILNIIQKGGLARKGVTIIKHPIDGPNEIEVILKPFLIYNGNQYQKTYLTGINKIDKIIKKRIIMDYTRIKEIPRNALYFTESGLEQGVLLKPIRYQFKNKLIYLFLKKTNNNGFSHEDYNAIKDYFDPEISGPDTWMSGNIIIYEGSELKKTKRKFDYDRYIVELGVRVIDIKPHLSKKNIK